MVIAGIGERLPDWETAPLTTAVEVGRTRWRRSRWFPRASPASSSRGRAWLGRCRCVGVRGHNVRSIENEEGGRDGLRLRYERLAQCAVVGHHRVYRSLHCGRRREMC